MGIWEQAERKVVNDRVVKPAILRIRRTVAWEHG